MKTYVDRGSNYTVLFNKKKYIHTYGIYQITNLMNGKFYIGSSVRVGTRWSAHKSQLNNNKHNNQHLQNSWNKYGGDKFIFELVEYVEDIDKLVEREQYWLDKTEACKKGYNISPSANNSVMSEETKQKIREKRLGTKHTEESKEKMSKSRKGENNVMYGKNHTEESKEKMSKSKMGKNTGKDNPFYGKTHTEETKQKISQANTGRKMSEEWVEECRERMVGENNPFYGKHHKEESIDKIIKTNRERGIYSRTSERMKLNNPNADGKSSSIEIEMLDLEGNTIMKFSSLKAAGKYLHAKGITSTSAGQCSALISYTCKGQRKDDTAYGYIWRYCDRKETNDTE